MILTYVFVMIQICNTLLLSKSNNYYCIRMNRLQYLNMMAKDNSKKSLVTSSQTSLNSESPPVARVLGKVGSISVKQQIAWAKSYKRMKTGVTSGVGTKFRQTKSEKKEEEEYIEIDYNETKPPAIFVDGYNIIGHAKTFNDENMNLEESRDCLINDLCVLTCLTGWYIEVVFDAYKVKGSPRPTTIVTDGLIITYTGSSETADNYIERRFGELKAQQFTNMVVATDDMVLRTVAGSEGSGYMTASILLEEIRIAYMSWENTQLQLETDMKRKKPSPLGDKNTMSQDLKEAYAQLKILEAESKAKQAIEAELNKEKEAEKQRLLKQEKENKRRENLKAQLEGKERLKVNDKKQSKRHPSNHHKPTLADGLSQDLLEAIKQLSKNK